jgi:hypothetical protein
MLVENKILKVLFVAFFCVLVSGIAVQADEPAVPSEPDEKGVYTPMEPIPGTQEAVQADFPSYVDALYKFLIWTSGIAAFFMINVGGFMYFTAAGNASRAEKAKGIISDALLGLVAVLTAYLILYIINPNLVTIDLTLPE